MPTKLFVPGLGRIDVPDDVPLEDTRSYVENLAKQRNIQLQLPQVEEVAPEREGTAGPIEALVGGTKRLLSSQFTTLSAPFTGTTEAAVSGIERQKGIEERPATSLEAVKQAYEEEGLLSAAKEVLSQIPGAITEQAPFLAEMYAGAKAGAALPVPPQFRPITAIGGALTAPLITAFGTNVERQAAEQMRAGEQPDVDVSSAALAAVPQAAGDVLFGRIAAGRSIVGKLLGKTDEEIAATSRAAAEKELQKLGQEGLLGSLAQGTVRTAGVEIPVEIGQQFLERWQAGLPLTSDDALAEYGEAAYGAGLVSPIGTVGRLSEKGQARQELGRRKAEEEFEASTPNVSQIAHPVGSTVESTLASQEANSFLGSADRSIPAFGLNSILEQTGDSISTPGDASAVANELLRRGEIVQEPGNQFSVYDADNNLVNTFDNQEAAQQEATNLGGSVFAEPQFRFLQEEEKIAPTLGADQPFLYAAPASREGEPVAQEFQVSNAGIKVTRRSKTMEEAENIKKQMDARVKRMADPLNAQIKELQDKISAIQENLDIAVASDMTDEQLGMEYDNAQAATNEARSQIAELENQRSAIEQETIVEPIGQAPQVESGYEVRLYRPGRSAKVLLPFGTREEAEQFIVQNAPGEQQQAIFNDQTPERENLRRIQKELYAPEAAEAPTTAVEQTVAPEPTPEMQERVQAVTSRLRGTLDQMGLQNVGLNISNQLNAMVNGQMTPVDGYYLDRVINASLSAERGVESVVGHETVHALRELGMFSDKEWNILSRKAKDEWLGKYQTEERYKGLNAEEQIEEAIADAFGEWMGGEYKPTGVIRGLLNRIKMFLESVGSALRGQGFDNTEKVFKRAAAGELRGARVERPSEGAKFAVSLDDFNNLSPASQRVMESDFLYSPLNRLVANAPKKLDGQSAVGWRQWFKANEHMVGGKEGEFYWSGLDDWLINQGKDKVTQAQIGEYLKQFDNPRDVVYEAAGRPEIGVMDVTDQLPELVDPMGDPVDGAYEFVVNVGNQDFSFVVYYREADAPYPYHLYDTNDEFMNAFSDIESVKQELAYEANESLGVQGNTKYSQYVLDGGENYREIPVVLSGPQANRIVFDFYNTHFPDANVLYHLRTNDRQDVGGNNVLFIEEVQSDWAQRGREAGFTLTPEERAERQRKIKALDEEAKRINDELASRPLDEAEREDLKRQRKAIRDEQDKLEPIPVGPYVQDTGKWVELAAKRIIAMAVNGGYDKVAFINPAQAHQRFPEKKDGGSTKEGFENFYGKILPNKLNSLLKKYGSQVEVVELPVVGDTDKWATDSDTSQQLGFAVTPELASAVRQNGFPKFALPMKVLAQNERKPTTNANGLQIHPTKDGVRNFWRWFGDSPLVDESGRPRVFYHASMADIEKFKKGTAEAIFFAPNPAPLNTFLTYKASHQQISELGVKAGASYPVYLNVKNPFDYENPEHVEAVLKEVMQGKTKIGFGPQMMPRFEYVLHPYSKVATLKEDGILEDEYYVAYESPRSYTEKELRDSLSFGSWPVIERGEVIAAIKKLGFDGFYANEAFGGQFYKNIAVFSPNNIKSTVGNNGQFAPNDARIQYALQLPRTKISQAISRSSKPYNPNQDPMFATPFQSAKAGINVLNFGINNTPTIQQSKGPLRKFLINYGNKGLQFFQLSGLADVFGDDLPIRPYYDSIRKMMGGRDKYIQESTEIAEQWQRLNARSLQDGNNTATVMNKATYYRYDPSPDAGNKNKRAPKTKEEIEIQRMFDALPAPYKKLYVDVRNFYRNRFEDFFKMLEKRVTESVKDPARAKLVIEELKKKYNYYNQIEPYFPLTRFGDYWVRYVEGGQTKFEMFENASDQDTFRSKIMSTPGVTNIEVGKKIASLQGELGASDFVSKIMDSLDQAKGGFMGQAQIDELKDSVWQLYLANLPELSMRKQFLHRANVPGYSGDALRAFQKNAFHSAYHMARLEWGAETARRLNDIRTFVDDLSKKNHPNAVWAAEVFQSINSEQRQKQIWRPDETGWFPAFLGQVGFLYFLSTAASATTNLAQNFTHAFPIMGTEFGFDKATKEFARAYKQFFESPSLDDFKDIIGSKSAAESVLQSDKGIRSIFDMTRTLEQLRKEAKSQKEKDKYTREIDAINTLYQSVITRSQAMDLAGATDRVTLSGSPMQVGMRFISMLFHGAEVLNRTTTGIVSYRLQMEKLAKEQPNLPIEERHKQSIQRAVEIVDQSHFNYSEANRSPFMGSLGGFGKVIFMFKSYALAETTFLINGLRVWTKVMRARWSGTPLEQKAIDDSKKARKMLLGVMGMQAMFAGVLGLPTPLIMAVMGLTSLLGDDDEEDKDVPTEVKFKQWLVETFGDNMAQAIAYGPLSYVTGADFNARVGMDNLWFRSPNPAEDELDQTKSFFLSLGGPIVGLATNFVQGMTLMEQGQIERGWEKMVPNNIKSVFFQGKRFREEGALTPKGDVILDEFSTSELALTYLGFTPMRLSLEYKQQAEKRGVMFRANLEKKRILMRFNLAVRSGDFDALEEINEQIMKYNRRYSGDPITGDTLSRSLKATQAAKKEMVRGLRIPKKQRMLTEGVSWLNQEEEED